jgi:DNA-binding NarL/FixJ family response regulator
MSTDHHVEVNGSTAPCESGAKINVFVLHSQVLVAESLGLALGQIPDFTVVAARTHDLLAPERVRFSGADVVLMDASPEAPGVTLRLLASTPTVRVVILAAERDGDLVVPCVAAGAVAFLTGSYALEQIAWVIRRVVAGWVALSPEQLAMVFRDRNVRVVDPGLGQRCATLTSRERRVLEVLATGATTAETARRLRVSTATVQTHIRNCLRKLDAPSKLAAVVMALRGGAIQDPVD